MNPRPSAWQADVLPLNYARFNLSKQSEAKNLNYQKEKILSIKQLLYGLRIKEKREKRLLLSNRIYRLSFLSFKLKKKIQKDQNVKVMNY